ncbi:MAG: LamG domain-containing protein, partial [Elusimicrobia bacterium]|nr:LamG domain-containing protein [Elusimicrobiota bacterium]
PKPVGTILGEWPMDEMAGGAVDDLSSFFNDGIIGNPQWTVGVLGSAIHVESDDNAMQAPGSLPLSSGFTFEAWVKPEGTIAGSRGAIMGQGNTANQAYLGLPKGVAGLVDDRFNFFMTDQVSGITTTVASTIAIVNERWYHVAATYDGAKMRLYVDGILSAEANFTSSSGILPFVIGRHNAPNNYFHGSIDHPRVVQSALDGATVSSDYRRGGAPPYYVEFSSTTGAAWETVRYTVPWTSTVPYVSLTGVYGSTGTETITLRNINLNRSNTLALGALANNQIKFIVYDVAGSSAVLGPYAVIVDTIAPKAVPKLEIPAQGTYVKVVNPTFRWSLPAEVNAADITRFHVQASTSPNMFPLRVDEDGPSAPVLTAPSPLDVGATYYWRVQSRDALGVYSAYSTTSSFRVDSVAPNSVVFVSFSSTAAARTEPELNDLAFPVTAQLTISDPISGIAKPSAPAPAASTLLYWHFDSTSGATAIDSSGNFHDGTLQLSPAWTDGRVNAGLTFNGVDQFVQANTANLPGDFTMEAWVNPASAVQSGRGGIMGQGSGNAQMYVGLVNPGQGAPYTGGRFNFWLMNGLGQTSVVVSTYAPNANTWYHLAAVYQSGIMKLYVNGNFQGQATFARDSDSLPFFVARTNFAAGDFFAGQIDEVRVVGAALTAAQIFENFTAGSSLPYWVEYSTSNGATWNLVTKTYPTGVGVPYLELVGNQGQTANAALKVYNLSLVESTWSVTGSAGTNQLRFTFHDLAGNMAVGGPYSVLVDTVAAAATPILATPIDEGMSPSSGTLFTWNVAPGLGSILNYDVQVALDTGFASLALSATTSSKTFLGNGLAQGTTYYWRVRTRTLPLGLSAYSAPFAVNIDTIAPVASAFKSFNAAGSPLNENQWSTLLSGVTAQVLIHQAGNGARGLAVSTGSFSVLFSSNAGKLWNIVSSTYQLTAATEPYVTLTGSDWTTAIQTMTIYNLELAVSTSGLTGSKGTNLVRFITTSMSGKQGVATYTILVDTLAPTVPSFSTLASGAEGEITYALNPSTDPLSGLHAQPYRVQISNDDFVSVLQDTGFTQYSTGTFTGLPHGVVYQLRAAARDAQVNVSTWSVPAPFNLANKIEANVTDLASPAAMQGQVVPMLALGLYNIGGTTPWNLLRVRSLGNRDLDVKEVLLFSDSNGNLAFDPPGSPTPDVQVSNSNIKFVSGIANVTMTSPQTITPTTGTYYVALKIDPLAIVGDVVAVRIEVPTSFSPIFANASFPITSGVSTVESGPATVTFTPADISPQTIPPGTANTGVLRFLAQTDQYTAEIASFTVRLTTGPETDVSGIKVFRDNGDGNFDPAADSLISAGNEQFVNRTATITLTGTQALRTVSPTVSVFFIAADISGAAAEGDPAGFAVDYSTWVRLASATNTVSAAGFPVQTQQITLITQNTLHAAMVEMDSTLPGVFQGDLYTFARLNLWANVGFTKIDRIQLTRSGLSFDSDVSYVEVWRDQDANQVFSTSLDAFLSSTTFSSGVASLDFAQQTIQTSTATFFFRLRVHPGAIAGNSIGFKVANSASIRTTVGYTTVDPAPYPLATANPPIQATVNTLTLATLDVAPGSALQGAGDVPMIRLAMRADRNLVRVTGLRIDRAGTAGDSDISGIKVYQGGSVFSLANSTLMTSGLDTFSGGTANVFLLSPLQVTPTTIYAYIALDVAPTAVTGSTVGVTITTTSWVSVNVPNLVDPANFPVASANIAIQAYPDVVRTYGTSLAPASSPSGTPDVLVAKYVMQTTLVNVPVTQVKVSRSGTVTDPEISDIRLWRDVNGDGALDIFSDVLVATQTGKFIGGLATIPLAGAEALPNGATYLMLVSLSTSAVVGRNVNFSLQSDSLLVASPSSADYGNFPHQTSAIVIAKPVITLDTLATSLAPGTTTQGRLNVPMLKLQLWAQSYFVEWNRLILSRLGSAQDADVTNIRVYRDANADGQLQSTGAGADVLVSVPGTNVFNTGSVQIPMSTQTVTVTTATYFVALDLSPTATSGNTLALQIASPSGLRLVPPDLVASAGFPIVSSFTTINPTVTGVRADVQDLAPPSLLQGTTNQLLASLSLNTTQYAALWRSLRLTQTGTAQDNDIVALNIWRDTNNNFTFEPATDTMLTSGNDRFVGGIATIQLSNREVIDTTSRRYFLTADVNLYADTTRTFSARIANAADVEIDLPNYTLTTGLPVQLSNIPLAKLQDILYTTFSDLAPSAVNQGFESDMFRIDARAGRDRVYITQLKVGRIGNVTDSDVAGVGLYHDVNANGIKDGIDVLVASTTLVGGQALLRFPASQNSIAASTKTFIVTVSMSSTAVIGRQVGVEVSNASYFTLPNPDVMAAVSPPTASGLAVVADARTPSMPVVNVPVAYWKYFDRVEFVWTSTVAIGAIVSAEYAIGTTPRGSDYRPFTPLASLTSSVTITGLPGLASGATYYLSVRARSAFGMTSPIGTSGPLLVDWAQPGAPAVTMTPADDTVLLTWSPAYPGPSGIMGYLIEYRTGTSPLWYNAKTKLPLPEKLAFAPAAATPAAAAA